MFVSGMPTWGIFDPTYATSTEIVELLRLQIEDGRLIVHLGGREIQRVAHARRQRPAMGDLPVVLDEVLLKVRAVLDLLLLQIDRERLHLAEQKARKWRACVGD